MGITNPGEEYFKDGSWGWDGTQWRKLPLVWGYSDRWAEAVEGVAVGAGDANTNTVAVGAGYVFVAEAIRIYHDAVADKYIRCYVLGDGIAVYCIPSTSTAPGFGLTWTGRLTLKQGDKFHAGCITPGDGKKIYLVVWGYKMKVT